MFRRDHTREQKSFCHLGDSNHFHEWLNTKQPSEVGKAQTNTSAGPDENPRALSTSATMFKTIRSHKRGVLAVIAFAGLAGLSVPVINLVADTPITATPEQLTGKTPAFILATPVLQTSCLPCHSSRTTLPWYAQWSVARDIIVADVTEAVDLFDMEERLYSAGKAPSARTLAKIEEVINNNRMPPLRFTVAHWNAFMSSTKKQVILRWIGEERGAARETSPKF